MGLPGAGKTQFFQEVIRAWKDMTQRPKLSAPTPMPLPASCPAEGPRSTGAGPTRRCSANIVFFMGEMSMAPLRLLHDMACYRHIGA